MSVIAELIGVFAVCVTEWCNYCDLLCIRCAGRVIHLLSCTVKRVTFLFPKQMYKL